MSLTSKLIAPGTKFIVTEDIKDSTFGPGTIGMMSYIVKKDASFENVAHAYVAIIRRGKGGMDRLNYNQINFPVFFDERMTEHKDYLPLEKKYHVNIKTVDYDELDLLKIKSLDFLGWASAYTAYIYNLTNNLANRRVWPSDPKHILNSARRIPGLYEESKKETEKIYASTKWRTEFIKEIRRMESTIIRCVLIYKMSVSDIAKNAAKFIKFTNDEYYKVTDDGEDVETIKFCNEKTEFIARMIAEKRESANKSKNFGGNHV